MLFSQGISWLAQRSRSQAGGARLRHLATLTFVALGSAACGDSSNHTPNDRTHPDSGAETDPAQHPKQWLPRGFLRLQDSQIQRTLLDIFPSIGGQRERLPPRFSAQSKLLPPEFAGDEERTHSRLVLDTLLLPLRDEELWVGLGCPDFGQSCYELLPSFAQRAWRRPLSEDERQRLLQSPLQEGSSPQHLRAQALQILHAPQFYLLPLLGEVSSESQLAALTDYEVASLLAYFLTFSPPDAALLQAANERRLSNPDEREAQARRLWQTPAGTEAAIAWGFEWTGVDYAQAAEELIPTDVQLEETSRLLTDVFVNRDAPVSELMSADYTFVNAELAKFYGLTVESADWQRVHLPQESNGRTRRGVMHHASWLRSFDGSVPSYAGRGKAPANLLCETIPPPPAGVDLDPPISSPNLTARQRMENYTAPADCQACHRMLNPLAFAFEHFDGFGAYRATENGKTLVSAGEVTTSYGRTLRFNDSAELALSIAGEPAYLDCYSRTLAATWSGTKPTNPALTHFAAQGAPADTALEAIVRWVRSEHFVTRAR